MGPLALVLHTAAALIGVVLLITLVRLPPVLALVVGALYLGVVTDQGLTDTVSTFTDGFGGVMTDVGLLIGFGVLIGSVLAETGALSRLVDLLDSRVGAQRVPYALGGTLAVVFPAIFVDALLVLIAPLVRGLAGRPGGQLPLLGAAVVIGLELGIMTVVPGAGILAIGGVLGVGLGSLFLYGVIVALPAALITVAVVGFLLRRGFWRPERDEDQTAEALETADETKGPQDTAAGPEPAGRSLPLWLSLSPLLLSLLLIAGGAIAGAVGVTNGLVEFVTDPVLALFVGLLCAYALMRQVRRTQRCAEVIESGLLAVGPILLLTGVGGGLAAVVTATRLGEVLGEVIGTGTGSTLLPIILAWAVAAMLRTATGSPIAGAVAIAGVLGPVAHGLGTPLPLIAIAAGAGGIFGLHVNSNFFWMFQSLLRLTTSGTLRSCTVPTCLVSIVALPLTLALGLGLAVTV